MSVEGADRQHVCHISHIYSKLAVLDWEGEAVKVC